MNFTTDGSVNLASCVEGEAINEDSNGSMSLCTNSTLETTAFDLIIHTFGPTGYSLLNFAPYKMWFLAIDFTLILPTVFGNLLIIIALSRHKELRRTKGFILIGNLAIADFLVGIVFLPMDILIHLKNDLIKSGAYCLCYYSVLYTLITGSVLNLLLLSVERCHAIVRPFRHQSIFTTKLLYMLISVTWMFVIFVGFLPVFGWRPYLVASDTACRSSVILTDTYQNIVNGIIVAALTVCFVCFIAVIRIALRKANEKHVNDVKYPVGPNLHREIKLTKLLFLVSGIFIICWAPFYIISFIPAFTVTILYIKNMFASLGVLNSCLNWIVYGARNRKFRAAFKEILGLSCWHDKANINSFLTVLRTKEKD